MFLSIFKISLILVTVGIIWISLVFNQNQFEIDSIQLNRSNSYEMKFGFFGNDTGFYKIYIPEFIGEEVYIQILDSNQNIIKEEMIKTKMSVGYFEHSEDGDYFLKVTNLAKNKINLELQIGDTNSKNMMGPGIMILVGILFLVVISFFKIKNYNTAQPDEKI
jgi:hypothetical protein